MSPKNFLPRPVSNGSMSTLAFVAGGLVLAGIAWMVLTGSREPSAVKVEALASPSASGRAVQVGTKKGAEDSSDVSFAKSTSQAKKATASSPNVIGASSQKSEGTISAGVARKLKSRAQYAEKLLAQEKKKTTRLENEVADLRARVEQMTAARRPPPPTEAEEVLETLRPLLSAKSDR